jgi:ferrous iron transport protein A
MKKNQIGKVVSIGGSGEISRRIRDMGIVAGVDIKIVGRAPLYDPVAIKVGGTTLTLRNNEADYIIVEVDE